MALKMTVETITPEKAAEYLKANTNNYRKLSRSIVTRYADDIRSGKWELNGEPIVFDENGLLKDGQHRLAAVMMAKKNVKMTVVRGVDESVSIYNIGSKRTVAQIVSSKGVECNCTVAAAARIIACQFKNGKGSNETMTYLEKHLDELNRAYRITCSNGNIGPSHNAACVAACYLMLRTELVRSYEAELFFRLFNDKGLTRADGYEISPAIIARKMWDERGKACRGGYQVQKERLEIIVMAMRDFNLSNRVTCGYKIQEPFFYNELIENVKLIDEEV